MRDFFRISGGICITEAEELRYFRESGTFFRFSCHFFAFYLDTRVKKEYNIHIQRKMPNISKKYSLNGVAYAICK